MKPVFPMFKALLHDNRGSMLLNGVLALGSLVVVTTAGVEISRYINVKNAVENAADSALLACAQVSHAQDCETVARNFFEANIPEEYRDQVEIEGINVVSDPENLSWSASIDAKVGTAFAGVLGFDSINLDFDVKVESYMAKRIEAVFLLDTSASMCTTTERVPQQDGSYILKMNPDNSCKKLKDTKDAMNYIIDKGLSPVGKSYVGIVPFNHKVKLPNIDAAPAALTGSERTLPGGDPNYFSTFDDAETLAEAIPLMPITSEADKGQLKSLINSIHQTPQGRGWTRSNVATLTAALMLDPDNYSVFGGTQPGPFDPKQTKKIVVMMTDGANIGCCYATHPAESYRDQYLYLYEVDNAHLLGLDNVPRMRPFKAEYNIPEEGLCDQMKSRGIIIYSVVLDVSDVDPGGRAIKDVYQKCATNEDYYFDIQDGSDLRRAYETISQSLFPLSISR